MLYTMQLCMRCIRFVGNAMPCYYIPHSRCPKLYHFAHCRLIPSNINSGDRYVCSYINITIRDSIPFITYTHHCLELRELIYTDRCIGATWGGGTKLGKVSKRYSLCSNKVMSSGMWCTHIVMQVFCISRC